MHIRSNFCGLPVPRESLSKTCCQKWKLATNLLKALFQSKRNIHATVQTHKRKHFSRGHKTGLWINLCKLATALHFYFCQNSTLNFRNLSCWGGCWSLFHFLLLFFFRDLLRACEDKRETGNEELFTAQTFPHLTLPSCVLEMPPIALWMRKEFLFEKQNWSDTLTFSVEFWSESSGIFLLFRSTCNFLSLCGKAKKKKMCDLQNIYLIIWMYMQTQKFSFSKSIPDWFDIDTIETEHIYKSLHFCVHRNQNGTLQNLDPRYICNNLFQTLVELTVT